jgi:uncharacterized RDD family membrane protein YckC
MIIYQHRLLQLFLAYTGLTITLLPRLRRYNRTPKVCPHCGEQILTHANYCGICGAFIVPNSSEEVRVVPVESQPAGFWIRFLARLIDELFVTLMFGLLISIIGVNDISTFILIILNFSYFAIMTNARGQTLGKRALGIQVVDSHGNIPHLRTVLVREIPCKILSALPLYLGYAWTGWDINKRAWHDHLAKTFVIKKPRPPDI